MALRLATRRLDQNGVVELPDTTGARVPFFLPDGSWVGFWAAGSLKKIAIDGGAPVILCEAANLSDASWGEMATSSRRSASARCRGCPRRVATRRSSPTSRASRSIRDGRSSCLEVVTCFSLPWVRWGLTAPRSMYGRLPRRVHVSAAFG